MSKEMEVWKCEKCGLVYVDKMNADSCCKDKSEASCCKVCGNTIEKYRTMCDDCLAKERYEKGTKIKYSEYDLEWLYDNNTDRYFSDVDALSDHYDCENLELPKWCYGCDEIPFVVNIDSALENASEEMYEDFDYGTEAVDLGELIDFIDKWNKKQTAKAYESNYKKIILLNE